MLYFYNQHFERCKCLCKYAMVCNFRYQNIADAGFGIKIADKLSRSWSIFCRGSLLFWYFGGPQVELQIYVGHHHVYFQLRNLSPPIVINILINSSLSVSIFYTCVCFMPSHANPFHQEDHWHQCYAIKLLHSLPQSQQLSCRNHVSAISRSLSLLWANSRFNSPVPEVLSTQLTSPWSFYKSMLVDHLVTLSLNLEVLFQRAHQFSMILFSFKMLLSNPSLFRSLVNSYHSPIDNILA